MTQAVISAYLNGLSIPQVSCLTGINRSGVRSIVVKAGIVRTRTQGVRMAGDQGRLGGGFRGKTRTFSRSHCEAISRAKKLAGGKGVSLKPSGYLEFTTGPHKGRGVHRVVAETILGRPLMPEEHVHHKDENRANNDPENLKVMTRTDHARHHRIKEIENGKNRERDQYGRFT